MKTRLPLLLALCFLCAASLPAQQPKAVTKSSAAGTLHQITEDLIFGAARTLTVNGTLNGTPVGGTFNLSNVIVTLPSGTGADGATLVGSGAPSAGTGRNGDVYQRTDTGGIYTKSGGTWTLQFTLALSADLAAKANAADGTHTGTTTIARADITKLNLSEAAPTTLSNGQTMNLSNSYNVYPVTFTGATATIGFHASPQPGVYRIDGITTYAGGNLRVSFPTLIRAEQDIDTPISYLDFPATSSGKLTIWYYVDAAGFSKVQCVGDTITQRDPDAFHRSTAGEIAGLAAKATPVAGDKIAGNDSQNGDVVRYFTLGSLPISNATQAALDGKANLSGGNTYTGTQGFEVVVVPKINMAVANPSGVPSTGEAWFYQGADNMPYVRTEAGVNIPFGIPPFLTVALSDATSDLTTGFKDSTRAARAFTILEVRASLVTASTSGAVTVDVKKNGVSIFSTLLTIDQDEKTSKSAATPAVLTTPTVSVSDDDEISYEVPGAGTGAKGLKITYYMR